MLYSVIAFVSGRQVCAVATMGAGIDNDWAAAEAHVLREEYPDAVIAILPRDHGWPPPLVCSCITHNLQAE